MTSSRTNVAPNRVPPHQNILRLHHRCHSHRRRIRLSASGVVFAEHALFLFLSRVIDQQLEHKPIQLRQRQRIGSFLLDRILGGERNERLGELMRNAIVGDAQFLHRLQHAPIACGPGSIYFVGEQKIGEDRPAPEFERVAVFPVNCRAGDVVGHQVGSHLHAFVIERQGGGDGTHQQRFRRAGRSFQQHMATGEQAGQCEIDQRFLAVNDLANFRAKVLVKLF